MRPWKRSIRQFGHHDRASTKARRPSRDCRLLLEKLEDRSLLSIYTLYEVSNSPFPGGMVYEQKDNGPPVEIDDVQVYSSPPTCVVPIPTPTGGGGNAINILDTSAGIPIEIIGAGGNDGVFVGSNSNGSNGNVQSIYGDVSIENPGGHTILSIDDSNDPTARSVTLGNFTPAGDTAWGSITGLAPSGAAINYRYADTSSVHLFTGSGADTVSVQATGVPTSLVNVGGDDSVSVGEPDYIGSTLKDILGTLSVDAEPNPAGGNPGFTTLSIDDSLDTANRTVILSTLTGAGNQDWGSIVGLAPSGAAINYKYAEYGADYAYAGTNSVYLTTGLGADTVNVQATGVPTYLRTSGGSDTVNVGEPGYMGGTLQDIRASLYVGWAGAGWDGWFESPPNSFTLNIDDSGDTGLTSSTGGSTSPTLEYAADGMGAITGLGSASICFAWAQVNGPVNIYTPPAATITWNVWGASYSQVGVSVKDNGTSINGGP
jgi:hypothetical protein